MAKNTQETKDETLAPEDGSKKDESKKGRNAEIIQIYDTTSNKIRNARGFKLSSFENKDAKGRVKVEKSVEFIIIGKNHQWKMFTPFDEFVNANPHVEIPGVNNGNTE